MIHYTEKEDDLQNHIYDDIEELENIKILYQNKIKVFGKYSLNLRDRIQKEKNPEEKSAWKELLHATEEHLLYFREKVRELEGKIEALSVMEKDIDRMNEKSFWQGAKEYNLSYIRLKKELLEHSIAEEQLALRYAETLLPPEAAADADSPDDAAMPDNDTLLISEVQGKVLFPYKASEVRELLASGENAYSDVQTVIEERYTVPLSHYKYGFISRYKEAFALMREKEKASLFDSFDLALELMGKRYVHPAIIRACKDSDQLDIYLDCLETNELEDFPFFRIEYELLNPGG